LIKKRKILSKKFSTLFLIFLFIINSSVITIIFKALAIGSSGGGHFYFFAEPRFYFGCLFFLSQTLIWLMILRRLPLSKAYPITSVNLIVLLPISYFYFGELITINNLFGSIIILAGVVVLSKDFYL
jgi:drug/metabolite transporter (DMT)-like permease